MPEEARPAIQAPWRPLPRSVRRLAAASSQAVLLETSRRTTGAKSYLFTDPIAVLEPRNAAELEALFDRMDRETARGHWAAGYLAYEAGFALEPKLAPLLPTAERLAWMGIFRSVEVFDHASEGDWEPDPPSPPVTGQPPVLSHTPEAYARQVQRVRDWIAAGQTYQANLTMEACWPAGDALATYSAAMAAQPVEYGAWLRLGQGEDIISASPELFFRRIGQAIHTRPMKGTASRGRWAEEDDAMTEWLQQDAKNRAENVMIVDLLRSDLGRLCEVGSVRVERLFAVERFPTVLQMTSDVLGTLREGLGTGEIFRALFPSGSIVGAPKIETMRLLHQLESRRRGVYTGAIGCAGPGSQSAWSVAIRTIHQQDGVARMGVGSGLVWDSRPESEFQECANKLAFLSRRPEPFDLIETLLWDTETQRLLLHIARLQASAAYFGRPFDEAAMRSALENATRAFLPGERWRVRLRLDGSGAFHLTSTRLEAASSAPVRVLLVRDRTSAGDVFLAHKTTRRALYNQTLDRALALGCADALFCNRQGELTEGAISNVFAELDGAWVTPPLACGVLPGIVRAEWLQRGLATERRITLADLPRLRRLTLTNAVRGAREIAAILVEDTHGNVDPHATITLPSA